MDIIEKLKNCPVGTELYSLLHGKVTLVKVTDRIEVQYPLHGSICHAYFLSDGRYLDREHGECVLFPAKGQTWKKWKMPVKPRFRLCNWIIYDKDITIPIQIIDIKEKEDIYVCRSIEGIVGNYSIAEVDKTYHLWSICDAKEGDIITTPNGNNIFIVRAISNPWVLDHCALCYDEFKVRAANPGDLSIMIHNCDCIPATFEQRERLFAKMHEADYEWNADKKELVKTYQPKFTVNAWIARDQDGFTVCISEIRNGKYYFHQGGALPYKDIDKCYHLWSIKDAVEGQILTFNNGWACIFKHLNKDTFDSYCFKDVYGKFYAHEGRGHCIYNNGEIHPVTNEQRLKFLEVMKKAGCKWDADKKELKDISHYDISNFYVGMPVLVRADNKCIWNFSYFSHVTNNKCWGFAVCNGVCFTQCIPFNKDTEHLSGTTEPCDERYINW